MRRHLLALFLAFVMALTMTGCGGSGSSDDNADPDAEATEETSGEDKASGEDEETEDGEDAGESDKDEQASDEKDTAAKADWKPTMPITMIVNSEANQGVDAKTRLLCQYAEKYVGQTVYFENMVGDTGTQGWEELAAREPDGMTLSVVELPGFNYFLRDRRPDYSPRKYTAVCTFISDCAAIVVRKNDSRFDTAEELAAFGQAHPGELVASANGDRGIMHQATQAFAKSAVFTYTPAQYGSAAEAVQAVRSGAADFCTAEIDELLNRDEDLQILAVFSEKPIDAYPDVPTLGELGYYDQWLGSATCIVAPAGTPDEMLDFYCDVFQNTLKDDDFREAASGTLSIEFRDAADTGTLLRKQQQYLESRTEDFWTIVLPTPEPDPNAAPPAEG